MRKAPPYCQALVCAFVLSAIGAQAGQEIVARGHFHQTETNYFNLTVPAHDYDLILARPEKNSVTLSVLAYCDLEGYAAYGKQPGLCTNQMPVREMKSGAPVEFTIGPLLADTKYYYQFHPRHTGATQFDDSPEFSFHTARNPGSSFTFTLTADSHLDEHTSAEVYQRTLAGIRADLPDFNIDLGNLFMTDKHATRDGAAQQYLAQRFYLGQIGCTVPLYLALGTHDGESGKYDDGSGACMAVWANLIRKRYFPNPVPDNFYSGDSVPAPYRGLLQNYYAWQWGDALFVVLDPFDYSVRRHGGDDGWDWSLGHAQYEWLKETLEQSRARYKFIFIHNLLSGDQSARGGVEVAAFNEWGGNNLDGSDGFKQHRPGWDMPVHSMLVLNHVTAVFKAHDNFYARQELDGIPYIMIPQPSFAGNDRIRDLQTYGYKQGVFYGNSGYVRVVVSAGKVAIQYVKTSPTSQITDNFAISAK